MGDALQSYRDAVHPRAVPFTPLHLSQYRMDVTWALAHSSPSKPPWISISGKDEGMEEITFWAGRWKRKVSLQIKLLPSCCYRETGARLLTANPKPGAAKPEAVLPSWLGPEAALAGLALDHGAHWCCLRCWPDGTWVWASLSKCNLGLGGRGIFNLLFC